MLSKVLLLCHLKCKKIPLLLFLWLSCIKDSPCNHVNMQIQRVWNSAFLTNSPLTLYCWSVDHTLSNKLCSTDSQGIIPRSSAFTSSFRNLTEVQILWPLLLSHKLWEWNPAIDVVTRLSCDSNSWRSLRTTIQGHIKNDILWIMYYEYSTRQLGKKEEQLGTIGIGGDLTVT